MRVISCFLYDHHPLLVLLAALMCVAGATVTTNLLRCVNSSTGIRWSAWMFLVAVCSGSSIWATHFIAMLAYETSAAATFEPVLTLVSIVIAIVGSGIGFGIASSSRRVGPLIIGGGLVGLSISAMHFTGMFAYSVVGIVSWDPAYIVAAILSSVVLSILSVASARWWTSGHRRHLTTAFLVAAIVTLHFTGMAAFQVTPIEGFEAGVDSPAFRAMALAILLVGLLVVGTGFCSSLIDDRTRALSDEHLRQMAFQDFLTGLANRRAFQLRLDDRFPSGDRFSLILVDLDHFKAVNDTLGHSVGDALLLEVAHRIRTVIGPEDFAARIGGDELAILVAGDAQCATDLAETLVRLISGGFQVKDHTVVIGCSAGVCHVSDAADIAGLMSQADLALYEAKRRGRGQIFAYQSGMFEHLAARQRLGNDLKIALAERQFHLAYQPIVDIASRRTIGYEALIRWDHPIRGLVSPAEFIPIAEENGSIVEIGAWVLEEACRQARAWGDGIYVAVNVSAVQLRSPLLLAHVTHALSVSGLPADRLEIEMTETAIVSDDLYAAHLLNSLRLLGTKIAMDDFGTGYSSLAHLRSLPLDRIKIDRSFVCAAATDSNSMAVLRAIVQLGRDMMIPTTGEGVETHEQLRMLEGFGCNSGQGYLLGHPSRTAYLGSVAPIAA